MRYLASLAIALLSLPASAIECIRTATPVTPVLVLQSVDVNIQGNDSEEILEKVKKRLLAGGKYRVAMPDQYRFALENRKIDKCTPAFGVKILIKMDISDPGAAVGFVGVVTRHEFTARAEVEMLPSNVSVETITFREKADSFLSAKKAEEAFERVMERMFLELESKRDAWTQSNTPGF